MNAVHRYRMTAMKRGDRVRLLTEPCTYGSVITSPEAGRVNVLLDDGRVIVVGRPELIDIQAIQTQRSAPRGAEVSAPRPGDAPPRRG